MIDNNLDFFTKYSYIKCLRFTVVGIKSASIIIFDGDSEWQAITTVTTSLASVYQWEVNGPGL